MTVVGVQSVKGRMVSKASFSQEALNGMAAIINPLLPIIDLGFSRLLVSWLCARLDYHISDDQEDGCRYLPFRGGKEGPTELSHFCLRHSYASKTDNLCSHSPWRARGDSVLLCIIGHVVSLQSWVENLFRCQFCVLFEVSHPNCPERRRMQPNEPRAIVPPPK